MKLNTLKKTLVGLAIGAAAFSFAVPSFAATNSSSAGTYVTQEDDTFWKISRKLHIPLADLMAANSNIDPLNVYAGIRLKLPGTAKVKVNSAEASGQTLAYSKVITAKATAYSAAPEENGGWGAVDYFGKPLKLGTIAVDPSVIPLGSKVYITGYSFDGLPQNGMYATAADLGGAIQGNRVDIFIPGSPDKVESFGIQNVKIYVLN
jgi:3D (Asp-Asp-Asp) domain-containing protein